jgi:hypothetical protein
MGMRSTSPVNSSDVRVLSMPSVPSKTCAQKQNEEGRRRGKRRKGAI